MEQRPIVLLEFNELCPALMARFISQGHLPNFKKLRDESAQFISEAEERAPFLEPWIQWINVHTGVPYSVHGIFHLSDGHKVEQPAVWDLISDAGRNVWVCGSMNIHCRTDVNGSVLPDPWSTDVTLKPGLLKTYFEFVRRQVQEHSNADAKFSKKDYLSFLSFMASHGLSSETISTTVKQLMNERSEGKRWRRAFILELLQFDLFANVYKKEKPAFSTFFLNSTAHMQHVYWRNMEPELFAIKPSDDEQKEYSSAIVDGYIHMDKILGRMMELVGTEATIIFGTAISQQPFLKFEEQGGKHIYRPRDIGGFIRWAGVTTAKQCNPVMAEQFWVEFASEAEAAAGAEILKGVHMGGTPALMVSQEGASVFCGFCIRRVIEKNETVTSGAQTVPFFDLFYKIEGIKSGMHHPDGLLWIRDPRISAPENGEKVKLESIAPTILEMMEIGVPAHMHSPSLMQGVAELQPA